MSWTDERVTLLKKLWGEGQTAAEIAKALGSGFSRNAVIGKAHRLKLSSRLSPIQQNRTARPDPAPVRALPKAKQRPQPAQILFKGIPMVDLKERMCRFPQGDPRESGFSFCGCDTVPGLPYCPEHARIAYQAGKRGRLVNVEDQPATEDEDEGSKMAG